MTRMPLRMVAAAALCVAVSACGTQFKPETLVDSLLVLAVQADRGIRGKTAYQTLLVWPYAVAPAVAAPTPRVAAAPRC